MAQNPRETAAIGITGCARCDKRWSGLNTAHCAAHRQGSHARGTRHCTHPETAGLNDAGRAYPCWGFPTTGIQWWTGDDSA